MATPDFWSSTAGLFKTVEVLRVLVYVSAGLFLGETLHSAPFDWALLTGKRQRRWTQLVYLAAKLSYLAFLVQIITAFWLERPVDCQAYLYAWEFLMGLTVLTSSGLLALRTIAVHRERPRSIVKVVVFLAGAGLTAAWMQGVTDVTAVWTPAAASPWNSGACLWTAVKDTYYVKYVVTILFDLLVVVLTIVGIVQMNSSSRIGDVLIRQGLVYFLLTLAANLVVTVLTILKLSPTMSLIAAIPQSTICVIASTRLYAQLAEEATGKGHTSSSSFSKQQQRQHGSHQTSTMASSSTSKLSTLFRNHSFSNTTKSLTKDSDLEKGVPPPASSPGRRTNMDDILELQSQGGPIALPDHSQQHPFSNLAVLKYDNQHTSPSLPKSAQHDDEGDDDDDDSVVGNLPATPSQTVAARYPRLFRHSP